MVLMPVAWVAALLNKLVILVVAVPRLALTVATLSLVLAIDTACVAAFAVHAVVTADTEVFVVDI